MSYHPARVQAPRQHPFVGWFLSGAAVAAITAVLAVVAQAATALYASAGSLVCFLAAAEFYRRLALARSRSVAVRGVSGQGVSAPDRTRWGSRLRALSRVRGVLRRPLTPDMTPDP
jgi:hypothetical protein